MRCLGPHITRFTALRECKIKKEDDYSNCGNVWLKNKRMNLRTLYTSVIVIQVSKMVRLGKIVRRYCLGNQDLGSIGSEFRQPKTKFRQVNFSKFGAQECKATIL